MTGEELEKYVSNTGYPHKAVLFDSSSGRGIAISIGENLSSTWQSGDIMCIWPDGERSCCDCLTDVKIIHEDLFNYEKGE